MEHRTDTTETDNFLINLHAPVLQVKHRELERVGDSLFRSRCPVCKQGFLLVYRDQGSFELLLEDRCMLCGQSVFYTDREPGQLMWEP